MKPHRFDPSSFVLGSLLFAAGVSYLFGQSGAGSANPARLWPPALLLVGLALVGWAISRAIRPDRGSSTAPAESGEHLGHDPVNGAPTEELVPIPETELAIDRGSGAGSLPEESDHGARPPGAPPEPED